MEGGLGEGENLLSHHKLMSMKIQHVYEDHYELCADAAHSTDHHENSGKMVILFVFGWADVAT